MPTLYFNERSYDAESDIEQLGKPAARWQQHARIPLASASRGSPIVLGPKALKHAAGEKVKHVDSPVDD